MAEPNVDHPVAPTQEQLYVRSLVAQLAHADTEPMIIELIEASALSNEIHPIFAHSQWEWNGLSDLDLLRIAPALVLASRLLTCCRALHFWHAVLRGPRQSVSYGGGEIRQRFDLVHDPETPLPAEEETLVTEALIGLARKIRLSFQEQTRSHGYCTPVLRAWSPNDKPMLDIVVVVKQLKLLDISGKPWHFLLRRWTRLAITLVHEGAHAFNAEHHGWDSEAYFGDNKYIEMGDTISGWLIGGHLEVPDDVRFLFMEMTKVGTSERARGYGNCGTSAAGLERLPPCIHCWLVGIGYIWRLFLQKFWQEDVPASARMALQAPRFGCGCALCPETTDDQYREWYHEQRAIITSTWPFCPEMKLFVPRG